MADKEQFYTATFKGDARQAAKMIFQSVEPFGELNGVSAGNLFEENEDLIDALEELIRATKIIGHPPQWGALLKAERIIAKAKGKPHA